MDTNENISSSRRSFIKTLSVGAAGMALPGVAGAESQQMSTKASDPHICMGLNTLPFTDTEGKVYGPGECLEPNVDLHSCEGGNSCKGLGACGTGDYARQYWVAENDCGMSGDSWNGTGGCGVPIGNGNTGFISAQLNSAAPGEDAKGQAYPADFLGQPIWNIARARFEKKMADKKQAFGVPAGLKSPLTANQWKPKDGVYPPSTNKLPNPYPQPQPPKVTKA
ncbi:twin-arginine translocation signal domain-containing protein [Rubritalea tangerina]|uniref:Twin-arginine translocation signal domain-containing protein n=1 Tax=Rubritalea tangerina TaxID=430798 RepID=A0ABW4ZE19_9BACT